jgi:WD40 repeat protein
VIPQLAVLKNDRLVAMLDGKLFARGDGGWIPLLASDRRSARILGTLPERQTLVVRCDGPARCELWNIEANTITAQRHFFDATDIYAASHDGRRLALGYGGVNVELVDTMSDRRQMLLGHHGDITALDFSLDDRTLVSASKDGTARLWNVATGTELCTIVEGDAPLHAAKFLPDGRMLAICGDERENGASLLIFRTE